MSCQVSKRTQSLHLRNLPLLAGAVPIGNDYSDSNKYEVDDFDTEGHPVHMGMTDEGPGKSLRSSNVLIQIHHFHPLRLGTASRRQTPRAVRLQLLRERLRHWLCQWMLP